MKLNALIFFPLVLTLAGCDTNSVDTKTTDSDTKSELVGADSDKHGCKASAGYAWCSKTKQCERPWEIAKTEQFENTPDAYNAFCENQIND